METLIKKIMLCIGISVICFSCDSSESTENDFETITIEANETVTFDNADCQNVVIYNNIAYAACGAELLIKALTTDQQNRLTITSNDVALDEDLGLLFVQSRNELRMFDLNTNPFTPLLVSTLPFEFGAFVGTDAANGILVVSGGTRNTLIYSYTLTNLSLIQNGIEIVDQRTGAPDVHLSNSTNGTRAFYSQDLGGVRTWGIQIVDFNTDGSIRNIPSVIPITNAPFSNSNSRNSASPSNFPVEAEFLENKLYVAHFAANGIEVIDLNNNTLNAKINVNFEPTNITTNGTSLFVVGGSNTTVAMINPVTSAVKQITLSGENILETPTGIAANENHLAIADRSKGLIIVELP